MTARNAGGSAYASSAATATVQPAPPTNTTPPQIAGVPREGESLTATDGTWKGTPPLSYAYQWRRCDAGGGSCADIAGATAQSYTLQGPDVGQTLRVQVSASNAAGSAQATSGATATVQPRPRPPQSTSPPTVSGSARDGETLTASPGSWSGDEPIAYTHQWRRCDAAGAGCTDIAGAKGPSYALEPADVDRTIRVHVTAVNDGGWGEATSYQTATVAALAPSNTRSPVVVGAPKEGETLKTTDGEWKGTAPLAYAYRWRRCDAGGESCQDIAGATGASYKLTSADVASTLRAAVTATNAPGQGQASSDQTPVIQPAPPAIEPLSTGVVGLVDDVEAVQQPNWSWSPLRASSFGSGFEDPASGLATLATGDGRLYVAAPAQGRVYIYGADNPATESLGSFPVDDPRGIAFYRHEVYVSEAGERRVSVFDRDGDFRRAIATHIDSLPTTLSDPRGLDVAFGRLFVLDGELVKAYDALAGALLALTYHPPDDPAGTGPDPNGFSGRDVSVSPEDEAFLAGRRLYSDPALASPSGLVWPSSDTSDGLLTPATSGADWCPCQNQRGSDWAWGMRWLLSVDDDGAQIDEYDPGRLRRSWSPTQARVSDVAYRKREARIEWSDRLVESDEWLRSVQPLGYAVTDADIYLAGQGGEHWYELARTFQRVELKVDSQVVPDSDFAPGSAPLTAPNGTLLLKTDARHPDGSLKYDSGPHTLTLTAYLADGHTLENTRAGVRFDNTLPTGTLLRPASPFKGTTTVAGTLADVHAGPRDWTFEALPRSAAWTGSEPWDAANVCPPTAAATCTWASDAHEASGAERYPDGWYRIRARLRDQARDSDPSNDATWDGNFAYAAADDVLVDNHPPTLSLSGALKSSSPLPDGRHSLSVTAQDGTGSGVKSVEVLVDGLRQDFAEQQCDQGACTMARTYTLRTDDWSEGAHTVTVVARDFVGFTTEEPWQVSVQNRPTLSLSGALKTQSGPLPDGSYGLHVDAQDGDSGVKSVEILVDGARRDYAERACDRDAPAGSCPLARDFTFVNDDYSEGVHTVRVVVTDQAGHTQDSSWNIDIRNSPP